MANTDLVKCFLTVQPLLPSLKLLAKTTRHVRCEVTTNTIEGGQGKASLYNDVRCGAQHPRYSLDPRDDRDPQRVDIRPLHKGDDVVWTCHSMRELHSGNTGYQLGHVFRSTCHTLKEDKRGHRHFHPP